MTDKELRQRFGQNLKRMRAKRGLSQLSLATMVGMAHNFINDIENGRKWVSPETISKLSNALEEDPLQFFIPVHSGEPGARKIDVYLDELSESVIQSIKEIKEKYYSERT